MSIEQSKNSILWEKLHQNLEKTGSHTQYPHEILVRWISINSMLKGSKVLDIGFGSGRNLEMLEKKGYEPYGIEVSPTAIKYAKKISRNFKLANFNPPKIDFPDKYFSLVISMQALYYNLDIEEVMSEIFRVMKDNAYVYVSFYGRNHWWIKTHSKKISSTFIKWAETNPAKTERGLKLRYFDTKRKYLNLFRLFKNIEVNKYSYDLFGNHYEYVFVIAQKIEGADMSRERNKIKERFKSFYLKQ